ncbi:MAG: polysaccharide biosynthesis/export family protein [Cyclobacteriaceae bacterium]|nr:polysaccharide biosynthesis/export family protein [Cyclobacteriaceae bacterium]
MFKVPDESAMKQQVQQVEKNYIIQKNDLLAIEVYTNNGERILDPDFLLSKDQPNQTPTKEEKNYLVDIDGRAKFPLIDEISVAGLTLRQAEDILQKEFERFYHDSFVKLKYLNKRVVVLGAPGGQVIPLTNDNTRLVEILALSKGLSKDAKAHNIRVIRGQQVFVVDFSTFEGYTKHDLLMEPGDIVYVEPVRRPFSEGVQEYAPFISLLTSITTLILVIDQSN